MAKKFAGFQLIHGCKPIRGKDYSEDGDFSQDDYEFLTGTGDYSNNPDEVDPAELNETRASHLAYEERSANMKVGRT